MAYALEAIYGGGLHSDHGCEDYYCMTLTKIHTCPGPYFSHLYGENILVLDRTIRNGYFFHVAQHNTSLYEIIALEPGKERT